MHGGPIYYWHTVVVFSVHKLSHHASSACKFKKKKCQRKQARGSPLEQEGIKSTRGIGTLF